MVPSVLKDTTDFLHKLQNVGHIPSTAILCSIDVIGLYPHIPHEEGLEALRQALLKVGRDMPIDRLVALAKIILENNYFEFDEKVFRQKLGTAIGTKFAPGFANIFMGYLEERFIGLCDLKPWVWWRFLDDVFMIWLHSEEELKIFLDRLNTFHNSIKFTWEIGFRRICFLDVAVTLTEGGFVTDVYNKPTDVHQYLNYGSCHPPHVKRGIPYGQGLRLKRICGSDETLKSRLDDLRGFLMERGYDQSFIDKQFVRVRNCNHAVMQGQQAKKKEDRICLVLDFHPALKELFGILHELHSIVGLSENFLKVLPEKPLLSFRRPRNLKDHLVRSKLRNLEYSDRGMNKCGKRRCQVCNYIITGTEFTSTVTGGIYHINHAFNCDSKEVVYLITCKYCNLQYVGNAVTQFRLRFNNHKSSLLRFCKGQRGICGQGLYAHFFEQGHGGLRDLQVQIIDVTDINKPNERESFWIEKLMTYCPKGLNVREEN